MLKDVVVPGYRSDKKVIKGVKSTISVKNTVTYKPNGRIIPVNDDGNELKDANQPIYKTSGIDPTQVESVTSLPEVKGYTCDLLSVTPEDSSKDTKVVYKAPDKQDDVLIINVGKDKPAEGEPKSTEQKPAEKQPIPIKVPVNADNHPDESKPETNNKEEKMQEAINFFRHFKRTSMRKH